MANRNSKRRDHFGGGDSPLPQLAGMGLAQLKAAEESRTVIRPYSINRILPDPRQPRRIFPASVRARWGGRPTDIPAMLMLWHQFVTERTGLNVNTKAILYAEEAPDTEDPVAAAYISLAQFAGDILRNGLGNAITIYEDGDGYTVIAGERRLMAYHMLSLYADGDFESIPAQVKPAPDVWAQASENNMRDDLNAISKARQLALLVMDLYKAEGETFLPFEEIAVACDREYYAQVANGYKYPVRKDHEAKVLQGMGLTTSRMLSAYRNLLTAPDDIWIQADEEGWAEGKIRAALDEIKGTNQAGRREAVKESLPIGKLSAPDSYVYHDKHKPDSPVPENASQGATEAPAELTQTRAGWRVGDTCDYYGETGRVTALLSPTHVTLQLESGDTVEGAHESEIALARPATVNTERQPATPRPAPFANGENVIYAGRVGQVMHCDDNRVTIRYRGGESQTVPVYDVSPYTPPAPPDTKPAPKPASGSMWDKVRAATQRVFNRLHDDGRAQLLSDMTAWADELESEQE